MYKKSPIKIHHIKNVRNSRESLWMYTLKDTNKKKVTDWNDQYHYLTTVLIGSWCKYSFIFV